MELLRLSHTCIYVHGASFPQKPLPSNLTPVPPVIIHCSLGQFCFSSHVIYTDMILYSFIRSRHYMYKLSAIWLDTHMILYSFIRSRHYMHKLSAIWLPAGDLHGSSSCHGNKVLSETGLICLLRLFPVTSIFL